MSLDQLYQRSILEHNRAPRHYGRLQSTTHSARGVDGLCGDNILIELQLVDDTIRRAMFSGEACAVTKASASMLTSWIEGQSRADALLAGRRFQAALKQPEIPDDPSFGELNHLRAVSSFPARLKNALLPWQVLIDALDQ